MAGSIARGTCLVAVTALLVACQFLPFLPGQYDPFAVTLSGLAQFLGFAGVLLVPLGTGWWVHEARRRRARERASPPPLSGRRGSRFFAIAALGSASLIAGLASFATFLAVSKTLGAALFVLSAYGIGRLARRVGPRSTDDARANPAPAYLVLVPLALLGSRWLFLEPAVESSRNRAIRNSAELIADIEAYRAARGHCPPSLGGLHEDYEPGVIGVREYGYEPRGEGYSVYFEQPAVPIGTREIVMYNELDEHAFPSHDSDVLLWTPEEQAARPGHYALHDAPSPHWKYFWFD